jgi:hypothetical protein
MYRYAHIAAMVMSVIAVLVFLVAWHHARRH